MTKAHRDALITARKKVRSAKTDLQIAEFDCRRAQEKLETAQRILRLLQGGNRKAKVRRG